MLVGQVKYSYYESLKSKMSPNPKYCKYQHDTSSKSVNMILCEVWATVIMMTNETHCVDLPSASMSRVFYQVCAYFPELEFLWNSKVWNIHIPIISDKEVCSARPCLSSLSQSVCLSVPPLSPSLFPPFCMYLNMFRQ